MMTSSILPLLVIFDLDFTLWPDLAHDKVPQALSENGEIKTNCTDRYGDPVNFTYYPEVPDVLDKLKKLNISLAMASKNLMKEANPLLRYFGWDKYFSYREIFLSSEPKTEHLKKLQEKSNVPFSEMIFFDDEERNISRAKKYGIFSVWVKSSYNSDALYNGGMNMTILNFALREYELLKNKKP